jgi:DNA-binding CsgD family transcriptional regulator
MKDSTTLIEPLSAREHEILSYIDEGLSYGEIGQALHLEKATVTWYVQQIYDKLGLDKTRRNHRHALTCARALGLLEGSPSLFPRRILSKIRTKVCAFSRRARDCRTRCADQRLLAASKQHHIASWPEVGPTVVASQRDHAGLIRPQRNGVDGSELGYRQQSQQSPA